MKIILALTFCFLFFLFSGCYIPYALYLRNTGNTSIELSLELTNTYFADLSHIDEGGNSFKERSFFRYENQVIPIHKTTYKSLQKRLECQVLNKNKVSMVLPAHSTIFVGSPSEDLSYKEMKISYTKQGDPSGKKYIYLNHQSVKKGSGWMVTGYSIYYDIN